MKSKYLIILVILVFVFIYNVANASVTSNNMQPIDVKVRGQRNKNPLNIKKGGKNDWQGTVGYDEQGHAIFSSIEFGTRAALKDISGKIARGINSIALLTDAWAEANVVAYANFVSNGSKIATNTTLKFEKETMRKIVYFMGIWESKYKLSSEQFETAWSMLS